MRPALPLLLAVLAGCAGPPPTPPASEAEFRALLARGSGPNVAATDAASADPRLHPRTLPLAPAEARATVLDAIHTLPRWQVRDSTGAVLWAVRATRLWRFRDDIFLLLEAQGDSSRILARSASRVGRGDFGQNRRNLHELWQALERSPRARGAATFEVP